MRLVERTTRHVRLPKQAERAEQISNVQQLIEEAETHSFRGRGLRFAQTSSCAPAAMGGSGLRLCFVFYGVASKD